MVGYEAVKDKYIYFDNYTPEGMRWFCPVCDKELLPDQHFYWFKKGGSPAPGKAWCCDSELCITTWILQHI